MSLNYSDSGLLVSAGRPDQFPALPLPQAVFSGRSNVGKSSLVNCLLGRKSLARVSSVPGKTVTVNFYKVGGRAVFVDLPGYGFARRPDAEKRKWSELTDGFFTKNPNIDLLKFAVQLVDLGVGPTADDRMMIDYLFRSGIPFAVAATKADKLGSTARAEALGRLRDGGSVPESAEIIPFSSKTGEGRDRLRLVISEKLGLLS